MRPSDSLTSVGFGSGSPHLRPTSWRVPSSTRVSGCALKTPGPSEFRGRHSVDRSYHEETTGSPRLLGHPLHACPQPTTSPAVSSPSPICAVTTLLPSGPSRPWAVPGLSFRWLTPRAHMFAYLRINESITGDAARLATGLPGSALAGRVSHPMDDTSDFKAASSASFPNLTSIAWSHPTADKPHRKSRFFNIHVFSTGYRVVSGQPWRRRTDEGWRAGSECGLAQGGGELWS